MAISAFAFWFFLSGYCLQSRPREPTPDIGLDHPVNLKGLLVYVSSFESFFLNNNVFYGIAVLLVAFILSRSAVDRVPQYDVRRGKIAWAPPDERIGGRRFAILVALWLALLVAGWRASL
ncbi:MAG TPA: hypothetical protein VE914_04975 [Candidatus Angelobacter sp.]|nr:hypothetical protein [Candidatus Angelobacter sp.]